jgi:hypothetical protein
MPGGDRVNGADWHQVLRIAGGLSALLLFIPMIAVILRDNGAGQSCATWLLWGALDAIVTVSVVEQHGNFLLPLGFTIGDTALVALLVTKRHFRWSSFETIILVLVIGCIIGWEMSGPRVATITATLGICVAGVPGLVALWKQPQRTVGNIWLAYVAANLMAFFGGRTMTVEERFAPGVFAFAAFVMFAASRRRR